MGCFSTLDESINHLTFRRQHLHREAVTDGPYTPWYVRLEARWVKSRLDGLYAKKKAQEAAVERRIELLTDKINKLRAQHATQWPRESSFTVWRILRLLKERDELRKKLGNKR
jgi:hypothetical protein